MFEAGRGGRGGGGGGGVPGWAFSGAARLDAAADRAGVGAVAARLAQLPGGPGLAATVAQLLAATSGSETIGVSDGRPWRTEERPVGAGGTEPGGTEPGGTEAGGTEPGGTEPGGTEPGGTEPGASEPEKGLDAASLVEVVAAFERVAAWARAGAARAAALLTELPETRPTWPPGAGVVAEQCTASTDVSLRLGITRHGAQALVDVGRALAGPLRQTGEALESGEVDWEKARALVELLRDAPLAVSVEVEAAVLPLAAALTRPQLVRAAQRALLRVDHRDAAERHARARGRRYVGRPRILPDGMAAMTAVLPAEAAVRLDACLQAAAVSARRGGDGRSTDQLRADALDTLARSAWDAGWIGPAPAPRGGSCGRDEDAGASAGIAAAAAWSPSGPTRPTAPAADAVVGARADLVPDPRAVGPTTPFTSGGAEPIRLAQNAGRGTLVSVTVGLGTLLGLDDRPGELAGYGPINADVARLLSVDGTWRRLVVDEPSGALLDVDRRHYRPPDRIVEHVRQRNRTCVFPTCSVPSASCQLDHTVPFPHGPTAADNLGPLCSAHHQLKTHGGFRLEQPEAGSFVVRTPTGHVYLEGPERQPGVPSEDDIPQETPLGAAGQLDPGRRADEEEVERVWPPPEEAEPPF
ncbi:MAG: DUF222 domain-containing protein [Actinotalea sp.]|nr:DUF222 domain-containing protein [Actinotalea sp.]